MAAKLNFVSRDVDRHGNLRLYFRRDGKKVRLRGPENSPEFFEDYGRALGGKAVAPSHSAAKPQPAKGSFRDLCVGYFGSAEFRRLAPRTQRVRRQILDRFCEKNGDGEKPYAEMQPYHLKVRRDDMADHPEAANGMLKAVRQVYKYAKESRGFDRNPAADVKYFPESPDGFHTWTPEEIARFKDVHPVGTPARLALTLALHTGQRRADLVALGPHNIVVKAGREWLAFTQTKNRKRNPVHLQIPMSDELQTVIDATGTGNGAFLTTAFGKPFTSNGFGNRFRKWCVDASLPHCSVHGLRKAAAARLAEQGCTEHEIMAITGHRTSKEVIRYTKAAEQARRAENASRKLHGQS